MKFEITNVNVDGEERSHKYDSIAEFFKEWKSDDYDGPGGDDEILNYSFDDLVQDTHNIKENKYGYRDFSSLVDILDMKRIEEILDDLGVRYDYYKNENRDDWYGIVEFWTDTSNQDIPTEFDFDGTAEDFVKKFVECADSYDVDEQVEIFSPMRGQQGVPKTIKEIIEDCQEAKDTLTEIADKLRLAIDDDYLTEYIIECLEPMIVNNSNLEESENPTMRNLESIENYKNELVLNFENGKVAHISVAIF